MGSRASLRKIKVSYSEKVSKLVFNLLIGFAIGVFAHWLILVFFFLTQKGKIFNTEANLNFQYCFLLATNFLWGTTGGVIGLVWQQLNDSKKRGLLRKYYASLGFLVGALGIRPLQLSIGYLYSLTKQSTFLFKFFCVFFVFYIPTYIIELITFKMLGFYKMGFIDETLSLYVGTFFWGVFIEIVFWGLVGLAIGYLAGFLKEKQTSKRSDKDESKS